MWLYLVFDGGLHILYMFFGSLVEVCEYVCMCFDFDGGLHVW